MEGPGHYDRNNPIDQEIIFSTVRHDPRFQRMILLAVIAGIFVGLTGCVLAAGSIEGIKGITALYISGALGAFVAGSIGYFFARRQAIAERNAYIDSINEEDAAFRKTKG